MEFGPEGSTQELGRILEDSINEIYVFDAKTLRFRFANRVARENLSYSMDELQQLTPIDLKPAFTADSFAQLLDPLRRGERQTVMFETSHRRKDASHYPVEVHVQLATYRGAPSFVAIILDSSARNAAEVALRESEALHRLTLESISDAVFVTGEVGDFRYICPNVDVIFGYSVDEVRSLGNLSALLGTAGLATEMPLETTELSNIAVAINNRDGQRRDLLVNVKRVEIRGGTRLYTCRDVTELNQAQQRLLQSERLAGIGQMVTALTHESRNTLQRIMANVEMLLIDVGEDSNTSRGLQKIASACDELHLLHEEVRDYAAPIRLSQETCHPGEVASNVWRELDDVHRGRDAELQVELAATRPVCQADLRRLAQVFRNLFENSLAACSDPVRITVRCEDRAPDSIQIRVDDNGPGFSEEARQSAFDAFFTTKSLGTGLGLAIVQRIIERHGGRIMLGAPSAGAEVVITLPRWARETP